MKTTPSFSNQRGAAMVISLMALLLLTMVGTLMMAQTKTETQIAGHNMRATQALIHAEAGYGEVLARMSDDADTANYIGEAPGTVTPGWGRYVVLASGNSSQDRNAARTESDGLDNNQSGSADETRERYPELLTSQGGDAINYPWVQVHYKLNTTNQVLLFGDHDNDITTPPRPNLVKGYPIIVVTAQGGRGSALRTVEVEAVKLPFQLVQTAIYSEEDDFKFDGTQFLVSGQDWDPYTGTAVAGNPEVAGIVTTEDENTIEGAVGAAQQNNLEGDGGEPSVDPSTADMDLEAMAREYSRLAEYTLPGGTYDNTSYGDLDHYTVVHCEGDMHTSGSVSGGGILIVDGDFDCTGSFTWYGIVLVLGDIRFSGGGQDVHIYGSCLVGGGGGGQQTVSGNANILYSSVAITRLSALTPYLVMNWREL